MLTREPEVASLVLVVDDDPQLTSTLELGLTPRGFVVRTAASAEDAMSLMAQHDFDAVLTDLDMPGVGGIELCQRVSDSRRWVPVIVLTAFGTFETAVAAIRAGAWDFLSKPARLDAIAFAIERAVHHQRLRREVERLRREAQPESSDDRIVARSDEMRSVLALVDRVAPTPTSVLLTGESGTGKEILARRVHMRSGRKGSFVAINCAAMPSGLLESELFGHVRGAFTNAVVDRVGLFEEADGGTLLLDEVGDMPLELQPKLLRVLEEREVRPIGARTSRPVDVRIVAATHRDLEEIVEQGGFREDLFFRLNVLHVHLPPLRARRADVLTLAQGFVEDLGRRAGRPVRGISAKAAERLLAYDWPGNVRELRNCCERAVAVALFDEIGVEDLPSKVVNHTPNRVVLEVEDPSELVTLAEVERRYVLRVLQALGGNKTAAARVLGIERKTLYRKLEGWGLTPDRERAGGQRPA